MKNFLIALTVVIFSFAGYQVAHAASEMKNLCKDKIDKQGKKIMDKKSGKPTQTCKKIKVHKKLEGTKVPKKAEKSPQEKKK